MDCYLQKRRGRWYFRMRVPKELHGCLHAEISYPIHGSDLTTALFRCKLLGERLKEIFEKNKGKCFCRFRCSSVKVMKSELTPKGAIHSVIDSIDLV